MYFSLLKAGLACAAVLLASCNGEEGLPQQPVSEYPSWKFSVQMGSLQLSDSIGTSTTELSSQLFSRIRTPPFFYDPAQNAFYDGDFSSPLLTTFSVSSQQSVATEYRWSSQFTYSPTPSVGLCSSFLSGTRQYLACENKRVFECLLRRAQDHRREQNPQLTSTAESSVLIHWLKRCDVNPQLKSIVDSTASFKIESGQVFFSPSPLSSVLIFKGPWPSYEEAQVLAIAAATLPQISGCNRSDASCLVSPVPVSQCIGCSSLEKGKIHTVFFFEGLRQDYTSIKSMMFVPD